MLEYRSAIEDQRSGSTRWWQGVAALGALAVPFATVLLGLLLARWEGSRTPSESNLIVADTVRLQSALERYRSLHHRYPPTLAALVPNEIDALPNRTQWTYEAAADGSSFRLSVLFDGRNRSLDSPTPRQPATIPEQAQ